MTNSRRNEQSATEELVVRAKTDREAFGALYDRFFPTIHRYCHRRLFDGVAADDVASEVFLQVARAIRRFPGTTDEDFRRWVYRIATNAINAHLRQKARRGRLFERALRMGLWSGVNASRSTCDDDQEAVMRAIATLGRRDQTVITLRFMEGLSYEEIGPIIDARPATVRVVASRAIQSLRRKLLSRPSRTAAPDKWREP